MLARVRIAGEGHLENEKLGPKFWVEAALELSNVTNFRTTSLCVTLSPALNGRVFIFDGLLTVDSLRVIGCLVLILRKIGTEHPVERMTAPPPLFMVVL